ncbi:MAG: pyridoxal 5'-phosphate synthase glutaminase subunit PdxT [Candidatus Micrarchaeota archaeon]|nr:pyridoxal 5'-phosphate synthase glutaminase subunit PdxT [Candidatus Micrarchaeota archaeon]
MEKIGVLSLQGDYEEHIHALLKASEKISVPIKVIEVRNQNHAENIDGLIIPGGESTSISRLMEKSGLFEKISSVRKIMGTCAGAILLAKEVHGATHFQRFLGLMDISVSRNAYGSQLASFEAQITTVFGNLNGVFIRAPKMSLLSKDVQPMAFLGDEVVGAYQKVKDQHLIALAFHPELTTTKFHEYFIRL